MGLEILTLGSSKTYTKESLLGGGAVVGKNVTISSITPIEGGNRITFSYTLDNGTVKTSTMDVMDGKDGIDGTNGTNGKDGQPGKDGTDGIGISKIEKIGTVDLIDTYRITFTDNSTFDYEVKNGADGQPGKDGADGVSPTVTVTKEGKIATITCTDVNGTTTATIKDGEGSEGGEANVIDSISVNGVKVSVDENKNVDITVPSIEGLTKDADLSTVAKSGSYEDLINKPTIPDITGLATETYVDNKVADYTKTVDLADVATSGSYNDLADKPTIPSLDGYAKTSEIPSKVSELENDSNYLSSIPEEYVTETELEAKGYLTSHQDISGKVDKVKGKSLIADTEIERLKSVKNYDDTEIKTELAKKANSTDVTKEISDKIAEVVSDAPESFNTLKEISDWIAGHEDDASAMNSAISDNKTAITALQTGKADKNEIPTTVAELTDSADYAKKTDIPITLPADGGNSDTVNNHTVKSDVPENAVFTDTTYSDATQIEHGLMSVDDKKKLDGLKKYTPDGSTITADEDGTLHGVKVTVDDALSPTSTNPVQNKVVKAYVDKKVSENVDFSTSTSKTLNDTVEAPLMIGKATRNLLNPSLQTTTQNGITCTNNGDGTYTLNGTAADTATFIVQAATDMSKEYIHKDLLLAGCPEGGSFGTYRLQYWNNVDAPTKDFGNSSKFQIKHIPREANIAIIIDKGFKANNLLFKPMLTTDLNATYDDFVPYSGYNIKTIGKNLLNPSLQTTTQNGITCTNNGDGTYTLNGTATAEATFALITNRSELYKRIVGKNILFLNGGHKRVRDCRILFNVSNSDFTKWAPEKYDGDSFVVPSGYEKAVVDIHVLSGTTINNLVVKPMITFDLDATNDDFVPYQDGGSVHIDSSTEFPLLGLKSFDGETNIISSGNVEVTYAKSDSGAAILDTSENKLDKGNVVNNQTTTEAGYALDARQANPNIDGSLAKQISDLNGKLSIASDVRKETTVNLLKPTLQTSTQNGVTCTNNGDGTYTLNGTATSDSKTYFRINSSDTDMANLLAFGITYKVVGIPKGFESKLALDITQWLVNYENGNSKFDRGDGVIFTKRSGSNLARLSIVVEPGVNLSNVIVKPMLTTNLNATYDDFVPYTGDSETLASDVAEIKKDLGGLTFSASGTTLTITDGTNTWTLEANS